MKLRPADTTVEAARVQNEILRRLVISGRAALTFDLIDSLRRIVEDGVFRQSKRAGKSGKGDGV